MTQKLFVVPKHSRGAIIARAYNRALQEMARAPLGEACVQGYHSSVSVDERGRKVRTTESLRMTLDRSGNLLVECRRTAQPETTVFFRHADGSLERRWSRAGNHRHEKVHSDGSVEALFQWIK